MKTDPNRCVVCLPEVRRWALIHDFVAHPLMALSGYAEWSLRFHDYTSAKAWPRVTKQQPDGAVTPLKTFLLNLFRDCLQYSDNPRLVTISRRVLDEMGMARYVVERNGVEYLMGLQLALVDCNLLYVFSHTDARDALATLDGYTVDICDPTMRGAPKTPPVDMGLDALARGLV